MSAAESRPAETRADGKCTHRIDVPVPECLYDAIGTLASLESSNGIGKAEYVRRLLERHVYGALGYLKSRVAE
jgi:hypothetical protein